MTVHQFTGVTAKITVSSSLVGFVSGDFTLAVATGRYNELNSNKSTSLTRGLRTVSGTLKRAWGLSDSTLYTYFNTNQMFDIVFDNDGNTGANSYSLSGCMLTDLAVEGVEAGSEGALMINASFEGLDFSRDA
ncbi:MAG: hypothetical protein CMF52_09400 [Legionellales bacterium]|nr:hypothetical protein [Legionellales bacterium]|tara:strand:+ start:9082 stop:9480 length:399 start_codon:yes stop_codon:yes gene_type:complete